MANSSVSKAFGVLYGLTGILGALTTIPQAIKIWQTHTQHIDGLSLITWGSYFIFASIGLIYGLIIKERPLIIQNAAYTCIYFIVALGILLETTSFW